MKVLPITDFLVNNAKNYKDEVALVEINPEVQELSRKTWREYELMQPDPLNAGRSQIT